MKTRNKALMFGSTLLLIATWWWGNDLIRIAQGERSSTSHGSSADGTVSNAVRLPSSGKNFRTYSRLGSLVGRTTIHDRAGATVLAAYADLSESHSEVTWIYGETGWPWGGDFWPHRTHQNGLVVDFMVPVRDHDGAPRSLPTAPWYGFGYGLDFDDAGNGLEGVEDLEIHFEALAQHLLALQSNATRNGLRIKKVILAPPLRKRMIADHGTSKLRRLPFSPKPVWVRHDDHYHVEFELIDR